MVIIMNHEDYISCALSIVTKDRYEDFVETVLQIDLEDFDEVIIVDDSDDDKTKKWCEQYPISYRRGPGINMQAARNVAISESESEIICFIDDDVILPTNFAERIRKSYQTHTNAVAIGGPCLTPSTNEAADLCYSKGMDINKLGVLDDSSYKWTPDRPAEVDFLHGANMSFRRKLLHQIGGFDTAYGGASQLEETDVCVRISEYGDVIYDPNLNCLHKEKGTENLSREEFNWKFKNHGRFVTKNFGTATALLGLVSLLFRLCGSPESIYQMLYRRFILNQNISLLGCISGYMQGVRNQWHQ